VCMYVCVCVFVCVYVCKCMYVCTHIRVRAQLWEVHTYEIILFNQLCYCT
jgi:hypothetical protein